MMITGVVTLDGPIAYEKSAGNHRDALACLQQVPSEGRQTAPEGLTGLTDEDFEIHAHVRRVALPGKADQAELEEFVSDLASTALDPSRPLWQFHYIENYVGGPVIVQRIHHCYADGIALVQVFLSLTDKSPEPPPAALDPARWRTCTGREVLGLPALDGTGQGRLRAGRTLDPQAGWGRRAGDTGARTRRLFRGRGRRAGKGTGSTRSAWKTIPRPCLRASWGCESGWRGPSPCRWMKSRR